MSENVSIEEVGLRLRAMRLARSWSLSDVEVRSNGLLKAVVLGSYERSSRTLSVKRALQIAELYDIPIEQIFSRKVGLSDSITGRIMLDLRAINIRAQQVERPNSDRYLIISRLAKRIIYKRQDWNGEILSLRETDVAAISMALDLDRSELITWLEGEQVLLRQR
jgi:transcriptional regulator with XRE-family HTH domain